ncbi:MAG: hypothetical protein JOZ54_25225 [Acidobacteria bacterium]|nr:hypothetical protein [Acidobacteriota bacterium]
MAVIRECDASCEELDFSESESLREVLEGEFGEIHERRRDGGAGRPENLAAIALSGGGIRSATFCLGLLQGLADRGVLPMFDYLSTVSGGGYVGGWWSAWLARPERIDGEIFPPRERLETERHDVRRKREERKGGEGDTHVSDSAMSAGVDPIHHLRLFSNFLTPRKGLLSADTWRAVAVIGRNLLLTWMILLPMMLVAIMVGQAYFALNPITAQGFTHRADLHRDVAPVTTDDANVGNGQPEVMRSGELLKRLFVALAIPILFAIGIAFCISLWMLANRKCWHLREVILVSLSGAGFLVLTWLLLVVTERIRPDEPWPPLFVWKALAAVCALYALYFVAMVAAEKKKHNAKQQDTDFWKNVLVRIQTSLTMNAVFLSAILLFAGFGHEVIDYLLYDITLHEHVAAGVVRAGGWTGIAMTLLGAIYTAFKGSPTGGGDESKAEKPSWINQLIFAVVPVALLLVLGITLAWVGHRLYTTTYDKPTDIAALGVGAILSAFLFLAFALYEFRPPSRMQMFGLVVLWLLIAIGAQLIPEAWLRERLITITAGCATFLLLAMGARGLHGRRSFVAVAISAAVALGAAWAAARWLHPAEQIDVGNLPQLVVIGFGLSIALLLFELIWGEGENVRSFALMAIGFAIFGLLAIAACLPLPHSLRALAMLGCIATLLGWILSLGWLADPNALTVHGFYKARLVRAYMGASNAARGRAHEAEITDAVPGDDVPLRSLNNCRQGAPYHLINTTLNLVGGHDLATVQRSSDAFLMSKLYCGSLRTGFRPTNEYMCGTMSLGTAVSVSGAAASPNMGAKTPSAALAMLLTLFNVRLGFWSPTPNQSYWRSGAARLWPVYTFQELLSQTTDLLPFCYLTDGGHFENTGVYPLIERGCRFILVADCGADPRPSFDDLGDLIRKVRIDFGAEIRLDLAQFHPEFQAHFIIGDIVYCEEHAKSLGLSEEERVGKIVVVKPNLALDPELTVDVRQYGFAFDDFPQQTTADQWYDEAQFESYRRLGRTSADLVATELPRTWEPASAGSGSG